MPRGTRKSVTIPVLLSPALKTRCRELGYSIFAPYAVELVCYDLRSNARHTITLDLALDTQPAQDAVDRELVAHYKPGQKREGLLVRMVKRIGQLQEIAARERNVSTAPLSAVVERVTFPVDLRRQVDVRWHEVGYPSFSAYLTGLARYDLLVGGPHASKTADCRSEVQRALTRKTLAARRKGRKRKLLLDHLIERAEGRSVAPEELETIKRQIAHTPRKFPLKG